MLFCKQLLGVKNQCRMTLFMVNSAELIIIPEGYLALSNIDLSYKYKGQKIWEANILHNVG